MAKTCVLVVEDDPLILMDTVDIVESAGFLVVQACSADEAIARLEANPAIRIVLTDVEMPGSMNGIKLAHTVRERWPPTAIIVMSGGVELANELPPLTRFIRKPYRPTQIEEALRAIPR